MLTEQSPKVIFHIGQHKTGSKALQSFLSINRENLLRHNIFYPQGSSLKRLEGVYHHSHFLLYVLAKYECLNAHRSDYASENFWKTHRKFCAHDSVVSFFEFVEKSRKENKAHTIIFSAEDLFDMQTAHELSFDEGWILYASNLLAQSARKVGWDPNLVVYLRRPDQLLNAHYAQFIKGSDLNHLSFDAFHTTFKPRLDAINILKAWENSFSKEKMQVRPYENIFMHGGIVRDFFENILGFLPDENWLTPHEDIEFSNKTPSKVYIDLIRESNLARSQGLPGIPKLSILELAFKDITRKSNPNWMGTETTQQFLDLYRADFRVISSNYDRLGHNVFFKQGWIANDDSKDYQQAEIKIIALQLNRSEEDQKHLLVKRIIKFFKFNWLRKLIHY